MHIRQLTTQDSPNLLNAINGAFADYIEPFQLNAAQLEFKMASEDIVPEWSVGIYEEDRLIAFIMHGVRKSADKIMLYNAGTGVLPEYRGQGLVGKMYHYLQAHFENNQVYQLVLEVIETNKSAIRAYEKEGFAIRRKLLCFSGELQTVSQFSTATSIKPLQDFLWQDFQSFWDITPSWQNAIPSMDVVKPTALGAFIDGEMVGYVLLNVEKKRIYQLAVAPLYRRKGIGTQILAEVGKLIFNEKVEINNMDENAENLKLFLEKQGLTNDINQFEMVKNLL